MKNKTNKKVVSTVKKFVAGAVVKANMLEKKGAKMLKKAEKKWDATKDEREKMGVKVKQVMKKAEKKSDKIIKKTAQFAKDIETGFKQGLKAAQKKSKR